MISLEQYKKVLDSGLLLDHYLILCSMRDGEKYFKNNVSSRRILGFMNLLHKKGYIDDDGLTEKAYEVIDIQPTIIVKKEPIETPKFDFINWVTYLHKRCQERLIQLTGKKQVTSKIKKTDKKGYPFLPNVNDLAKKLLSVVREYKLKDMDLVEKTILAHIDNCNNGNNWFPIIKYYISKDGNSQMVTEMDGGMEVEESAKSTQKFV